MRLLICFLVLIYTLPSKAQEASYCVSSLSGLTSAVKKKSKPMLYYPEFGKLGLYLTVKFGKSTYYLETKYANIEYDTKKKTLTAVCSGTRNCILSGKLTAPNRQPKKELASLKRVSKSDLQCYAGYLNQQIRRLKYKKNTNSITGLKIDKKQPTEKTKPKPSKQPERRFDEGPSGLDHEIAFLKFKDKAMEANTDCVKTLGKIFELYSKQGKAGDKSTLRRLYVTSQPLEKQARQYAHLTIQHIKNGRDYARKHKVREDKWNSLYNNAEIYLGGALNEDAKPVSQSRINEMSDDLFSILLRAKVTLLESLAYASEAMAKKLQ